MIICPKCKAELPATPFIGHWVVCLHCDHKWELNADNTAVKNVTIELHGINQETTNEGELIK